MSFDGNVFQEFSTKFLGVFLDCDINAWNANEQKKETFHKQRRRKVLNI